MTATCRWSKWRVLHRCPAAETLWELGILAHNLWLASGTDENKRQAEACWRNYEAHVKACAGGNNDNYPS